MDGGLAMAIFMSLVTLALCANGTYWAYKEKRKDDPVKEPARIELSDKEMSNFNWLDTCPDCGKIDHHPFVPIEDTGRQYAITSDSAMHLRVVERTCTDKKCGFTWYQK